MHKKPFLVIFLTVFLDLVGFGIIIPLSPYLAREYGASAFHVGLLMAIYSGFQFLFAPFWGQLSDRWGRRPIILISLMGSVVSHSLFAFAGSLSLLFIARALAGIFGANISAAMAYMADLTGSKERSKAMGLIGAAFGLGFVFGPFLGGLFSALGNRLGSLPPFGDSFSALAASGLALMNLLFGFFVLVESHPRLTGKGEVTVKSPRRRFAAMASFLVRPTLGPVMAVYFLSSLAMAHMEASLFLLVQDRFQWSIVTASMGFAYVGVVIAFTQGYLIRKTLPKWGESRSLLIGLAAMAVGFTGIGWAPTVALMAVVVTILALGNGLSNPALTGSVSLLSGESEQGAALGVNQSLAALGRILGPALGGYFYQQISPAAPFYVAGALTVLAFFIIMKIHKALPHPSHEY